MELLFQLIGVGTVSLLLAFYGVSGIEKAPESDHSKGSQK